MFSFWKSKEKKNFDIIFLPQKDITTYELALILKLTLCNANVKKILDEMPLECKRHLRAQSH